MMWRCLPLLVLCCSSSLLPATCLPAAESPAAASDERIAQWIEQLGATQYVIRDRAQQELQQLGVAAFDALLDAQFHSDIEIASRARYLLRSIHIPWVLDDDPEEVKRLVRDYETCARDERRQRMEQLAALVDSQGIRALCRLMRFEADPALSKQAAVFVLGHTAPTAATARSQLAASIRAAVEGTRRPARTWLLAYARTLESPESALADWEQISRDEGQVLIRFPEESDPAIARDLLRWRSALLLRLHRTEEATSVLRDAVALMGSSRQEVFDMLDWSLAHEVWLLADELAQRFPEQFARDAQLTYRRAEAHVRSGQGERAEQTALQALAIEPDRHERHVQTARDLINRQHYDWAERELRQVIAGTPVADEAGLEARFYLSELLFDLQRELAAAEVLEETVAALDKDPKILQSFNRSPGAIRALMHYRFAMHYARTNDRERQRQRLEEAIHQSPTDVDVLIAMYHLSQADAAWRKDTLGRIQANAGRLRTESRQSEEAVQTSGNQRRRADDVLQLASQLNQFAWLVSNTEGDFAEALQASRRSVELFPDNSAYLDTLGRCYYAVGDLANAVQSQTRAVQLEPSSQQLRRQLQFFQEELAAREGQSSGQPDSD